MVLSYHAIWNLGTVAASRFGTLQSPSAEVDLPVRQAKSWRKPGSLTVDGFAQGRSVPYLTLSQ